MKFFETRIFSGESKYQKAAGIRVHPCSKMTTKILLLQTPQCRCLKALLRKLIFIVMGVQRHMANYHEMAFSVELCFRARNVSI
ncbi:MAG: hypothetical protein ONB48_07265 [candidate division KSB1 bacterium]|nr:hypothetical protein [candidate division KSB1 bacterium]MDZ7274619.1 hypothetical protein [candidate division KSB1 bacterium]MDZ7285444.1 hypothetical protein [candidate division KSB1 bacterium]MDZ7298476.1 hypothetical protein [candidate division KSB1 bacterium]MDZ7306960.1 hypothetical protein [candidate division KSB1 bacterium]